MSAKLRDTVVLRKDIPEHNLKAGDIGAVAEVYAPDGLEVEFVTGSGRTQALVTLNQTDVRSIEGRDILAVRPLEAA